MASGTGGYASRKSKPYRRYKPLPALIMIAILGIGALTVWLNAVVTEPDLNESIRCTPSPTAPKDVRYTPLPVNALDDTPPIPPSDVAVRVLNASGARGEAGMATEGLKQLGFSQVAAPANDVAYENREAECHGQIRFGENGAGAARTIALIDTCLQLVRDNRKDATVDLALGTKFNDVRPSSAARQILARLRDWSEQHEGQGQSEQSAGAAGPAIDKALLDETKPESC